MRREVFSYNHCLSFLLNTRLLTKQVRKILEAFLPDQSFQLSLNFVSTETIAEINETFLGHAGSTDVITFDYSDGPKTPHGPGGRLIAGELFICPGEAITHASRFKTSVAQELMRYVVHGILHLLGYQDDEPAARRQMKREENRWLHSLGPEMNRLVDSARKSKRRKHHG